MLAQVAEDVNSDEFINKLTEAAKTSGLAQDPALPVRKEIAQLEKEKAKAAELSLTSGSATYIKLVEDRSRQIAALQNELDAVESDARMAEELRRITPKSMKALLQDLESPRALLRGLVERVELDPNLDYCRIHYRLPVNSLSMASPRGFEPLLPP